MGLFSKDDEKVRDPLDQLKELVPLNKLSSDDLRTLRDNSEFRDLKKGDVAFRIGDTDAHNVYLLSGTLALINKRDRETDEIEAGSSTARFPIAHDIPRKLTARAKQTSQIAIIDNHLLSKLLQVTPDSSDYEVSHDSGDDDDWMTQLLRSQVFQRLPAASIQGVMMNMEEMQVKKGTRLVLKGSDADYYLMHRGKADVIVGGRIVTRMDAGDRAGEDQLLSGLPSSMVLMALKDCVLEKLSRDDFLRYVYKPLDLGVTREDADARVANGAVWIDVRSPREFEQGALEGARNLPFDDFRNHIAGLEQGTNYICYCGDGKRSAATAFALVDRGFEAAYVRSGVALKVALAKPAAASKSAPVPEVSPKAESVRSKPAEVPPRPSPPSPNAMSAQRSGPARPANDSKRQARDDERRRMRDTLMELKQSLGSNRSELEATRVHAEEAVKMRERLDQMESLLHDSGGARANRGEGAEARVAEELLRQKQQHGSLENELSEAISRLEEIETQRSESDDLKRQLNDALSSQERAIALIDELERSELQARADSDAATQRVTDLEQQLGARETGKRDFMQAQELRNRLEKARLEFDTAQASITEIGERKERTRKELDRSGDVVFRLQREVEERERNEIAQEEESRRTITGLQRQVEQLRASQEQSLANTRAMEKERESLAQELEKARSRIKEIEDDTGGKVKRLQQELEQTRKRLESGAKAGGGDEAATRQMLALQKKLKEQHDALQKSENEREGLREFLESRSGELQDIKRALTDAQVEAEEADFRRQEAEAARKQVEDALSRLHVQVEQEKSRGPVAYDEQGNEVAARKGKGGLVVVILLAALGGGGGWWFMTQQKTAPPVVIPPPASGETSPSSDPEPVAVDSSKMPTGSETTASERGPESEPSDLAGNEQDAGTTYEDPLQGGGDGPTLVYIPGGEFTMGNLGDPWLQEENPKRKVKVKSFWMGIYEVTFDEYDAFASSTNRKLPDDMGFGRKHRPVIYVSYEDATAYTKWLSEQTGATYRLPSEAEWEYAARAGSQTEFWWGNSKGLNRANCFDCGSEFDGRATAPTGSFKPNPFGLYNTAGNVMEWTADCYNPNYRGAPKDGSAWLEGNCEDALVRGSAYNRPAVNMRSSKRTRIARGDRIPIVGFRVVREVGNEVTDEAVKASAGE